MGARERLGAYGRGVGQIGGQPAAINAAARAIGSAFAAAAALHSIYALLVLLLPCTLPLHTVCLQPTAKKK
jgi:hypothetical protein